MSIPHTTRRGFLKAACMVTGGMLLSIRMTGRAVAAVKEIKNYMQDRIASVYTADAAFPVRASQDNAQVKYLYTHYLEKPLSHKSEELLHTKWFDKSAGYRKLLADGKFPNPRDVDMFAKQPYPYE